MPDISTINTVAVADIDKFQSITFADGQKVNNQDVSLVTDDHVLIDTYLDITTSDTAVCDVTITSGIDSTYDVYEIHYTNIHAETDDQSFMFQVDTGSLTNYNQPMVTTFWQSYHKEDDSDPGVGYSTGNDQSIGDQAFQKLAKDQGNEDDESASGILTLYSPSSTAVFTAFAAESNNSQGSSYTQSAFVSGYVKTLASSGLAPITRVRFKMGSGDIDAGTIKMYGLAKS